GDVRAVGLPDGRIFLVVPRSVLPEREVALAEHARHVAPSTFEYLAIAAGVPLVTAATTDQFVPQTANWEVLGGVAFDKGCYTGQEIVARMQYLGRLKERLYRYGTATPLAAGSRLYSPVF